MLLGLPPKRVEPLVIGIEVLPGRIELPDPVKTELLAATDLLPGELALPWVDGAEAEEGLWMGRETVSATKSLGTIGRPVMVSSVPFMRAAIMLRSRYCSACSSTGRYRGSRPK